MVVTLIPHSSCFIFVSQECQRADWKVHKENCGHDWASTLSISWHQENHYYIKAELDRVTRQRNVKVQEVCLELDFMVCDGVAPALKDPPEFKIKLVNDLTEGKRQTEPAWFEALRENGYESQIQGQLKKIQSYSEVMSDGELLVIGRFDENTVSIHLIGTNEREGGVAVLMEKPWMSFDVDASPR